MPPLVRGSEVGRAKRAREEALQRVEAGSADWRHFADLALDEAASRRQDLTSDDVWIVLTEHEITGPTEPRAMGPVMLAGVRTGLIKGTNEFRVAENPATHRNHGRPQRVYVSLVTGQQPPAWPNPPSFLVTPFDGSGIEAFVDHEEPQERWLCQHCGQDLHTVRYLLAGYAVGVCPTHGKQIATRETSQR